MKKLFPRILLATLLSAVGPAALQAVAVPPELLQSETADSTGVIYGLIFLVLLAGIALGVWVQKKLSQS